MLFQAIVRRAWLKKGQKTVIKVEGKDEHQNYLGFLNQRTFKCHVFPIVWGRASEVIMATTEFLKLYPDKNICIIWDNARWHKGKQLRAELGKGNSLERIHLINLPPYAPDTNPQEHIWKYAKDHIAHQPTTSFKQKINNFKLAVIHRTFNYTI